MRPYILQESTWKQIQQTPVELAVLPWGATEAHNYHLPYGTDNIESEHIAWEAASQAWHRGARVMVLPVIPFGVNTGQHDITLDINLNPSTQLTILADILETLNRQHIHKLLIVNSHGGNDFKPMLRELGLRFPQMLLATCNWFESVPKEEFFEHLGDHADEMETSLMLYLAPELVQPLSQAGTGQEKKARIKAFGQGWAWTERKWSRVTPDTGIGNPKKASKEKGEKYFKAVCEKLATLMYDLAHIDKDDFYEP